MKQNLISRRAVTSLALSAAVGFGILTPVSDATAGGNGREIMGKVAEARKLAGSEAIIKLTIVGKGGQKRERKLSMATKVVDGGKTEKRIYRFLAPADVKGTGILVFDHATKADDIWVFLPALRKTRRIVSSQRSKSFMASEFSYADLNIPPLDDYKYNVVKEEDAGGESCYVIDVIPNNDSVAEGDGYAKRTYWISKSKLTVRKGLFYDLDGGLYKELKADNIKLLDPRSKKYRVMRMEITNKKNGRSSVFETEKVAFNPDTKDEFFTLRQLEKQ
jgi:hypothetical protein